MQGCRIRDLATERRFRRRISPIASELEATHNHGDRPALCRLPSLVTSWKLRAVPTVNAATEGLDP